MSGDVWGYYAALGLPPGSPIDAVRSAYRRLAKECHPDTPGCSDGGDRFRVITEAYEQLSDSDYKAQYDRQTETSVEHDHTSRPRIEPIRCEGCGKVTAQPRRLLFWRITSFVVASHKGPVHRILCEACAVSEQWKSTIWTSLLGWWGVPWGPIWAIGYGFTNALGGTRDNEIDEKLMWQNALAFAAQGNGEIAVGLGNILRKSDDTEIGQTSAEIIRFFSERGVDPGLTLKKAWQPSLLRQAGLLLTAFAIPLGLLGVILISEARTSRGSYGPATTATDQAFDQTFGPTASTASVESAPEEPAVPPEPLCVSSPANGEILVDHLGVKEGHRIEIDNGMHGDAIIKVRNAFNGRTVASFFVSRGASAALERIPDGTYKIQYAVGDKLKANCRSFVADGSASASEFPDSETLQTRYEEEFDGTRIIRSRLSYTLYPVTSGNVHPSGVDLSDFDKP